MILRELPRFIRLRKLPLDLFDRKELSTELDANDILPVSARVVAAAAAVVVAVVDIRLPSPSSSSSSSSFIILLVCEYRLLRCGRGLTSLPGEAREGSGKVRLFV